jgi:hypothetical protein
MDPNLFRGLAILMAFGALLSAFFLRKHRRMMRILVSSLAALLLLFKIGETIAFASHGIFYIPYEVSHLAYYLVPLLLLLGFQGSDNAAGSLSFVVGMGFLFGAIIKPDSLLYGMSLYEEIRLLLTHELLFFISLPLLFSFRFFRYRDFGVFLLSMLALAIYFLLLKFRLIFKEEDFNSYSIALQVMDGSLVRYLTPNPPRGLRLFFACGCILLIFLVPFLLFLLSRWSFNRKKQKGIIENIEIPLWGRYGLIPWILRRRKGSFLKRPSQDELALYR